MIGDDQIRDIRERTDLAALVGEYVRLTRSGSSLRGLCPFHAEKSPSFYVHPARQFFHCFGCQASGDAIGFVQRIDGVSFPDALRRLAEPLGIDVGTVDAKEAAEQRSVRAKAQRLRAVMEAAAEFYEAQLKAHPKAQLAQEELTKRGVSAATAGHFRLGYAPPEWDALCDHLRSKKLVLQDAQEAGLLVARRSGDGFFDRFRDRLLFTVREADGAVVAFSGRHLDRGVPAPDGQRPAKYINSPEGPLYRKGQVLYGLYEGRVALRRKAVAVVCEGNFDLVNLHQAGFEYAVAPMGTALTERHAKLLRRFCTSVVLLFDADAAGEKAVAASFPMLQRAGLAVRVARLPSGSDPDTFLREHGSQTLQEILDGAPGAVEHLIDTAAERCDADARSRADAVQGLGPIVAGVDNPVEGRLYLERIARRFGISDLGAVRQQLRRGLQRGTLDRSRAGAPPKEVPQGRTSTFQPPPLEGELIAAILDYPELAHSDEAKALSGLLTSGELRAIFQEAIQMITTEGSLSAGALVGRLSGNPATPWLEERLAVQKYDEKSARQALTHGVVRLARAGIQRELPKLQQMIVEARQNGDADRADALTRRRDTLYASSKAYR